MNVQPYLDEYFTINDEIFNDIHYVEPLGKGSYGIVKKCIGKINVGEGGKKRNVQISLKLYKDPRKYQSIIKEVTILKSLDHPNVIKLYEPIKCQGMYYLALEYATDTLHDRITHGDFTLLELRTFMKQMLEGIEYLHSKGILHNDLKPGNVYINEGKVVKIADFGLSRTGITYEDEEYRDETFGGTLIYKAPETLIDPHIGNLNQDIWSLACIFYEMCTKKSFIKNINGKDFIEKSLLELYGPIRWDRFRRRWIADYDPDKKALKQKLNASPIRDPNMKKFITDMFLKRPTAEELLKHPFWSTNIPTNENIFRPLVCNNPSYFRPKILNYNDQIVRPPMPFIYMDPNGESIIGK